MVKQGTDMTTLTSSLQHQNGFKLKQDMVDKEARMQTVGPSNKEFHLDLQQLKKEVQSEEYYHSSSCTPSESNDNYSYENPYTFNDEASQRISSARN